MPATAVLSALIYFSFMLAHSTVEVQLQNG